jgi:hypothetical protein
VHLASAQPKSILPPRDRHVPLELAQQPQEFITLIRRRTVGAIEDAGRQFVQRVVQVPSLMIDEPAPGSFVAGIDSDRSGQQSYRRPQFRRESTSIRFQQEQLE